MVIIMGALTLLRGRYQNTADAASAVKNLSDALDKATERQKEFSEMQIKWDVIRKQLEEKIYELEKMRKIWGEIEATLVTRIQELENTQRSMKYKLSFTLKLDENPVVDEVEIKKISPPKK